MSNDVYLKRDGADLKFKDTANDETSLTELKTFQQTGAASGRSIRSRLMDYISVKDFGAVGDGVTDDYAAIMAAINSAFQGDGSYVKNVPGIYFPLGTYYVSQTIQLKRSVRLFGDGVGSFGQRSATLKFPAGVSGIIVHAYNTIDSTVEVVPTTSGGGSIIEGLNIEGNYGAAANGIWLRCSALIKNVGVRRFSGDGIRVYATSQVNPWDVPSKEGNANNFRIEGGSVYLCQGNGLYVSGADSNAGIVHKLDCSLNGKWNFFEDSFLGNTYIACHTATDVASMPPDPSGQGPYKCVQPNSFSVFLGCYSEAGPAQSVLNSPACVIGGAHGAGITYASGTGTGKPAGRLGPYATKVAHTAVADATYINPGTSAPYTVTIEAGEKTLGDDNALLGLANEDDGFFYKLKYKIGKWYVRWANLDAGDVLWLLNNKSTVANGFPRERVTYGGIAFPQGFYDSSSLKYRCTASSAPASGNYVVGDIIFNSAPSAGGFVGWVCTVAGNPGTWKTFGAISP